MDCKITDIPQYLETARLTGDSVLLIGKHGIGKTEVISSWAKNNGYHLEALYLSAMDPGDMMGLMREDGKGGHSYTEPGWLSRMKSQKKPCVLFLDEFNRAHRDIRQASYPLLLSKRFHDHDLPEGTLVIAAINPDDNEYDVDSFDDAMTDRFKVFHVKHDVESWVEWAKTQEDIHRSVVSFIAKNPAMLWVGKNPGESTQPTPRSWTRLARTVAQCEKIGRKEQIAGEAMSCVGRSAAAVFYTHYKNVLKAFGVDDYMELLKEVGKVPASGKVSYADIEAIAESVASGFDDIGINPIQLDMLHKQLVEKYLDPEASFVKKGKLDLQAALKAYHPYLIFLYAIPVEVRASCLRWVKKEHENRFDLIFSATGTEAQNGKKLAHSIIRYEETKPKEEAPESED